MLKILVLVGFLWAIPMSLMAQGGDKWGDYRICANKMETNVVRFRLTDASMAAFAEETATCRSESDTACKERAREEAKKIAEDAIYVKTIKHEKHLKNSELNTYTEMISKGKGITQPFCSKRGEDSSGRATYTVRVGVIRIEIPPSEMKQLFPPTVEEKAERLGKEKEEEERLGEEAVSAAEECLPRGFFTKRERRKAKERLKAWGKAWGSNCPKILVTSVEEYLKNRECHKAKELFSALRALDAVFESEGAEATRHLLRLIYQSGCREVIKDAEKIVYDYFDKNCKRGKQIVCEEQIRLTIEQGKEYDKYDKPKKQGRDSERAYDWFKRGASVYKEYYTGQNSELAWVVYRAVVYHRLRNEDDMSEAEEEEDFKLACNHGVKAACKAARDTFVKIKFTNMCAEAEVLSIEIFALDVTTNNTFVQFHKDKRATHPQEKWRSGISRELEVDCKTDNGIADKICYEARGTIHSESYSGPVGAWLDQVPVKWLDQSPLGTWLNQGDEVEGGQRGPVAKCLGLKKTESREVLWRIDIDSSNKRYECWPCGSYRTATVTKILGCK